MVPYGQRAGAVDTPRSRRRRRTRREAAGSTYKTRQTRSTARTMSKWVALLCVALLCAGEATGAPGATSHGVSREVNEPVNREKRGLILGGLALGGLAGAGLVGAGAAGVVGAKALGASFVAGKALGYGYGRNYGYSGYGYGYGRYDYGGWSSYGAPYYRCHLSDIMILNSENCIIITTKGVVRDENVPAHPDVQTA
ncbi:hypothetical protein EVAR_16318_1 [Eumeta japonica]|uniref:Uncharacterized protein n=1 Tax=Eumeta variegata TaxID=151549 RepID=A0A4C1VFK1_EUMVA|nr:hypothetical protein EVAR_16318_1 [Eumeta japonica]